MKPMDRNMKLVRTLLTLIIAVTFLIMAGLLTGCTNSEKKSDLSEETITEDSKDKDAEGSGLKKEVASSTEKESSTDEKEEVESKTEEVSDNDEEITSSNSETKDNYESEYRGKVTVKTKEVQNEDYTVEYYVYGYDDSGKKIWTSKWSDLPLTEIAVASDFTVQDNRVLIEVGESLYSIDIYTGKRLWEVENVGASFQAPVVDPKNGAIYVTGYYEPFLTTVTQEGKIKWQIDFTDEEIYLPYAVTMKADSIIVKAERGQFVFDRDGKLLEKEVLADGEVYEVNCH
jgi:outer membrane protein assembly factor BamB